MCLAQGDNTLMPARLEPVAPQFQVKHSTTVPPEWEVKHKTKSHFNTCPAKS